MEEDLFADLYDGEESAPKNNAIPPVATQPAPLESSSKPNDMSGYGEEPDTAYDPTSFETETPTQGDSMNGSYEEKKRRSSSEAPVTSGHFGANSKEDG